MPPGSSSAHEIRLRPLRGACIVGVPMAPLLTTKEVCGLLRISRDQLYKLVNTGRLRASLVGRNYKFRESDVEKFLDSTATKK